MIVDSLKDAAVGLIDDEVGARWNRARQTALAAGVQVIELHHNRKQMGGANATKLVLDDLYGSTWLSSGAGSVILLSGATGDPIVGLHHIKQPVDEVGPLRVLHDAETGRSTVWHSADLVGLCRVAGRMTAVEAARHVMDVEHPNPAEREKGRRKLEQLTRRGFLRVLDEGDPRTHRPKMWGPV